MGSHDSVKFLLVDDTEENLTALEALLARDGLEFHKARNGSEALELLLVHDFALALLDVQMPDMDGFELAELMRATERTRGVPIIFITAVATDEWRRFRGYETGAVDYLFKPVDPRVLTNKANVFFDLARQKAEVSRQRDELHRTAQSLTEALGRIQAHADNSPLAIVEFDPDLRIIGWSRGATRLFGWADTEVIGKKATEIGWLAGADRENFASVAKTLLSREREREVHVHKSWSRSGTPIECEWYSSALFDRNGKPVSINAQLLDVTEKRRAEETQQLLIGELNHRVKNMLATVQAVAKQTLRSSANPADFASDFSGRIQALAKAHSLLSSSTWQGAELTDLIRTQLTIGTIDKDRLIVSGPEVRLPPEQALHLGLVLHELGTNANKYGALSTETGRVTIGWTVGDGTLQLSWVETGGKSVRAPTKRGFGTTLIERSAKAEGGTARASYRSDGITWNITFALSEAAPAEGIARPAPELTTLDRRSPVPSRDRLAGRRFLIVEDEPLVALETASVLEEAGAVVTGTAATVDQAVRLIEETEIDCALLDANLRGQSAESIAAALTRHRVPFLFVSGYGRESLPRAFAQAHLLSKPFTPNQLLEAAGKLLPDQSKVVQMRAYVE